MIRPASTPHSPRRLGQPGVAQTYAAWDPNPAVDCSNRARRSPSCRRPRRPRPTAPAYTVTTLIGPCYELSLQSSWPPAARCAQSSRASRLPPTTVPAGYTQMIRAIVDCQLDGGQDLLRSRRLQLRDLDALCAAGRPRMGAPMVSASAPAVVAVAIDGGFTLIELMVALVDLLDLSHRRHAHPSSSITKASTKVQVTARSIERRAGDVPAPRPPDPVRRLHQLPGHGRPSGDTTSSSALRRRAPQQHHALHAVAVRPDRTASSSRAAGTTDRAPAHHPWETDADQRRQRRRRRLPVPVDSQRHGYRRDDQSLTLSLDAGNTSVKGDAITTTSSLATARSSRRATPTTHTAGISDTPSVRQATRP